MCPLSGNLFIKIHYDLSCTEEGEEEEEEKTKIAQSRSYFECLKDWQLAIKN